MSTRDCAPAGGAIEDRRWSGHPAIRPSSVRHDGTEVLGFRRSEETGSSRCGWCAGGSRSSSCCCSGVAAALVWRDAQAANRHLQVAEAELGDARACLRRRARSTPGSSTSPRPTARSRRPTGRTDGVLWDAAAAVPRYGVSAQAARVTVRLAGAAVHLAERGRHACRGPAGRGRGGVRRRRRPGPHDRAVLGRRRARAAAGRAAGRRARRPRRPARDGHGGCGGHGAAASGGAGHRHAGHRGPGAVDAGRVLRVPRGRGRPDLPAGRAEPRRAAGHRRADQLPRRAAVRDGRAGGAGGRAGGQRRPRRPHRAGRARRATRCRTSTPCPRPAAFADRYDHIAGGAILQSVNADPDLPTVAPVLLDLYSARSGRRDLDGVVLVDPVFLAAILDATGGPIEVPAELVAEADGMPTTLTGDNIVEALTVTVYDAFGGDNPARRVFDEAVTLKVLDRLVGGSVGPAGADPGPGRRGGGAAPAAVLDRGVGAGGLPRPRRGRGDAQPRARAGGRRAGADRHQRRGQQAGHAGVAPGRGDHRARGRSRPPCRPRRPARRRLTVTLDNPVTTDHDTYIAGSQEPSPIGGASNPRLENALNRTWFSLWTLPTTEARDRARGRPGPALPRHQHPRQPGVRLLPRDPVGVDELVRDRPRRDASTCAATATTWSTS